MHQPTFQLLRRLIELLYNIQRVVPHLFLVIADLLLVEISDTVSYAVRGAHNNLHRLAHINLPTLVHGDYNVSLDGNLARLIGLSPTLRCRLP